MQNILDIDDAPLKFWDNIIKRAQYFKNNNHYPQYSQQVAGLLFYENSTRTRIGFELAAKKLGMMVVQLNPEISAHKKGESLFDTINALSAMGVKYLVVRHKEDNVFKDLIPKINTDIHLINAGTGITSHPSQALLDLMTIMQYKTQLQNLKVAIVGNISHSRVASSLQKLLKLVGIKDLYLVAPKIWQPTQPIYGTNTQSIQIGLNNADVVIALRVQKERIDNDFNLDAYISQYQINAQNMLYAKKDVIIMHPGPLNRGIEINDEIADGKSSVILEQVKNGVFIRMAMFEALLNL